MYKVVDGCMSKQTARIHNVLSTWSQNKRDSNDQMQLEMDGYLHQRQEWISKCGHDGAVTVGDE